MLDELRRMQIVVEPSADGVLLVRVAGHLTGGTGPRLLRLLDDLTSRESAGRARPERVVVDLGNVWVFDRDGVAVLRHARHAAAHRGVRLALGGIDAGRLDRLPLRIEVTLRGLGIAPSPPAALAPPAKKGVLAVP